MADNDQIDSMIEAPREFEIGSGKIITLRPFSLGSAGLFKKMGLTLFSGKQNESTEEGEGAEEEADEFNAEQLFDLSAFFWSHSTPVKEVLNHVRDNTWRDEVEEFALDIPMHKMTTLTREVNRMSALAEEAAVEVVEKHGDSDEDTPPPN